MRATSATGNRGFTLLELLVVLTILVLMASAWPLAAPRVFPTQRLRNEAQQLAAELRVARMTARLTGARQQLEISATGTGYRIATESYDLPDGLTVHLRSDGSAGPANQVTLFPDGSSTGGSLDLELHERLTTVTVAPLTGHVEIVE
jgi:general secretion pathway protein H